MVCSIFIKRLFFGIAFFYYFQQVNQIYAQELNDIIDVIEIGESEQEEDFYTYIDLEQLRGKVHWEKFEFAKSNTEYLVIVEADGDLEEISNE